MDVQDNGSVVIGQSSTRVSIAPAAVDQLQSLPKRQAAAVAHAIQAIRPGAGTPLEIVPPSMPTGRYLAIEPADPAAPVVIYRERSDSEGDGYLVTALADRPTYATYQKAERDGLTRTPLWEAVNGYPYSRGESNTDT